MKYKETSMSNVLSHAVTDTIHLGRKAEKEDFHIALTGTEDYIPHMGMVALTVHAHNEDMSICYHFFVNHLTDEEKGKLEKAAQIMQSPLEVHLIDDSAFKPLLLSDGVAAFFYRFLVAPTVAPVTDRVLYLDGDMMCRGSLDYLRNLDFKGHDVAVVSDRKEELQMKRVHTKRYFNAGMMLINVKQWMEEGLFDDIVRRAEKNVKRVGNRLSHHDQDIHNEMLDGKCLFIEKKYNYLYNLDRQSLFKKQPVNEDYHRQVIIHFAGHAKPWHSWVQAWPVVQEYAAIQKKSPWKDVPLVPPKGHKNLHQAARTARMQGRYGEMISLYLKYLGAKA
jgi:lipopolysaccharide 1,2-glucosyltransferase